MSTPRPRIVSIRIILPAAGGIFGVVYSANGHRWAELGPYNTPEAADAAARSWASARGFEVRL